MITSKNPFIYGQVVTGLAFTNREKERHQLERNFLSGIHTILISPRRWGKSSLVAQVFTSLNKNHKNLRMVSIDMTTVIDEKDFFNRLTKEIIKTTATKTEEMIDSVRRFLKGIKPHVSLGTMETNFELSIEFSSVDVEKGYEEILNLGERIAKNKKLRLVIALDEFQNIGSFQNPEVFQARLRSVWQHHKHVSYCFYGSKKHMMEEIFQNKSAPFYHFGDILHLKKIDASYLLPFIISNFNRTAKSISLDQAKILVESVECNPQYVQMLAHKVWDLTGSGVKPATVEEATQEVISQLEDFYQKDFEGLSKSQKNFLVGLINSDIRVFSQEFIERFELGSSANVAVIKKAMIKKDIIDFSGDKPAFLDPGFRLWLKKKLTFANLN